jgi:hypothetical protein
MLCTLMPVVVALAQEDTKGEDVPHPALGAGVADDPPQLVGWVERSDTHQSQFAKLMGFAKGSTHPTRRSIRFNSLCPRSFCLLSFRYGESVTIRSLAHSDGGNSVACREAQLRSTMSSSSGSTPISRR